MSQAVSDFYGENKNIYDEITVLDGTVDFNGSTEFISKSGIKKDVQTDAIEIILDNFLISFCKYFFNLDFLLAKISLNIMFEK